MAHIAFLENAGIEPDALIGSSAGALCSALYGFYDGDLKKTAKKAFEFFDLPILAKIEDFYSSIKERNFFSFTQKVVSEAKLFTGPSVFESGEIEKMFSDTFGDADLRDLKIPVYITAIDLTTGSLTVFKKGPISKILTLAVSIPLVFPPYPFEDGIFVDGGFLVNIPVSFAYLLGADRTYVSDISSEYMGNEDKIKGISLLWNILSINQSYINRFEKHLGSFVKRFKTDGYYWYSFSQNGRIYESASMEMRERRFDFVNKDITRRKISFLRGFKWNIR